MNYLKFLLPWKRSSLTDPESEQIRRENAALKNKLKNSEKEIEEKLSVIARYEKIKESIRASEPKDQKVVSPPEAGAPQKKKKIGEILVAHNLISKEMLDRALSYQEQSGCSITQYLLAYGYIEENQLAQCLCTQFGIPYLPLSSCDISDEIIKLVPVDIAQKYWLIPVDRRGDSVMVVMIDPLDTKAIKEVEDVTGYKVMPFVGIISEIVEALEIYYKVFVGNKEPRSGKIPPFFINSKNYTGLERRRSVRFKSKIDIRFAVDGYFKKSYTKNVSRGGVSFESEEDLQVGSFVTIEISLPKSFMPLSIPAIAQVVRVVALENNKFEISTKTVKMAKQDLTALIEYASIHSEE